MGIVDQQKLNYDLEKLKKGWKKTTEGILERSKEFLKEHRAEIDSVNDITMALHNILIDDIMNTDIPIAFIDDFKNILLGGVKDNVISSVVMSVALDNIRMSVNAQLAKKPIKELKLVRV